MTESTLMARSYAGADDLPKIQALIARTAATLEGVGLIHPGDFPHRMYNGERAHDPAEIAHLWEDPHGELLAWTLVQPRAEGFDYMVRDDYRNHALESEVIEWGKAKTIDFYKRLNMDEDTVGIDVRETDSQRIQLLEKHGFTSGDPLYNVTMRSLSDPIPELNLPEGFTVRSTEGLHEAEKLQRVHAASFDSEWTTEAYEKVMQSPGYDAERELVVVAPDGRFAAFCVTWFDDLNKTGLFEPVGTHYDFRRMGLATHLMYEGMRRMKAIGLEMAIVAHEVDNEASTNLYASLGFKLKHRSIDYTCTIDS